MTKKAVIAGASGLIGSKLLDIILQHPEYQEVLVLVRKELTIKHKKLNQLIIKFDDLANYTENITGHAVFCCLGTTKKKTPEINDYRRIDHDYPLRLSKIACHNSIEQYHLVSSLGANAASSNYYIKIKGETETAIQKVGLPSLHIYRPSFLTGERKENRLSERIFIPVMKAIDPFLLGRLKKYRSIPAAAVAMAMFKQSLKNDEGVFIYPSDEIKQLS